MQSVRYRCIIKFSFLWSWLVIALGAFTRLTDAGLSCPDWPGCYGQWYVGHVDTMLHNFRIWAEMVHRYAAGILTLSIFLTLWVIFLNRQRVGRLQWFFAILLLLLVLYQPVLGMWTVTWKLHPSIVTQHLLSGMTLMVLIGVQWLYFSTSFQPETIAPFWRWLGILCIILLYLQLFLGAWTSTNYAALSCDHFPFCHLDNWHYRFREAFDLFRPLTIDYSGGVISDDARRTIQVMHRFAALVVGSALALWASAVLLLCKSGQLVMHALWVLVLLIIQMLLGVSIIYFSHPLGIAISHTLVAAGLLFAVLALNYRLWSVANCGR